MKIRIIDIALLAGLAVCASPVRAQAVAEAARIMVGSGKTYILDAPADIERISIASPETAEAVPVSTRTVMINGKAPGETSAIVWLSDGTRKEYDVSVSFSASRMDAAKAQVQKEFGDDVQLTGDNTAVYLTGSVKNMFASQRAQAIASTFGRVVNLLKVEIPPQEQEILIKVKFADVDRSKSTNLGFNILGAPGGFPFNVTNGTNSPSRFTAVGSNGSSNFTLSDALNIMMFDPHADLLATIQALEAQSVLQILDEPNVLAMNGHVASFLAGGEFPFPTLQGGGSGIGQVTVSFREFGIKLRVTPIITPRGTIRLHIAPEVSSLDFADALTVNGGTVPALTTRRIETEVEVEDGQSFAIAGLLDRSTTETLSKIPGLSNIPVLGKLFTSKNIARANSELIVIVTPELVAPIPRDQPMTDLVWPRTFLEGPGVATTAPRTPGTDKTGQPAARPVRNEVSVQEMEKLERDELMQAQQASSTVQSSSGMGAEGGGAGSPAAPTITLPISVPGGSSTGGGVSGTPGQSQ
jgi:pilus assembly protein CpaC